MSQEEKEARKLFGIILLLSFFLNKSIVGLPIQWNIFEECISNNFLRPRKSKRVCFQFTLYPLNSIRLWTQKKFPQSNSLSSSRPVLSFWTFHSCYCITIQSRNVKFPQTAVFVQTKQKLSIQFKFSKSFLQSSLFTLGNNNNSWTWELNTPFHFYKDFHQWNPQHSSIQWWD